MKKLFLFASMLLAASAMMTSCDQKDNPISPDDPEPEPPQKTIVVLDGKEYETELIATFAGEIGTEVSLTLGVYDPFDIYGVDFGDGVIVADTVCFENGGLKDEEGMTRTDTQHTSATKFTGTIAGDGTVKVYGNSDLWYVNLSGGIVPTSIDQEKMKKVVQMSISQAVLDNLDLTGLDELKQFNYTQGSLKSINVSNNANLTSLTISNNSASKLESALESIDVSKNAKLEYLNLMAPSTANRGKLTKLDLSNNTAITQFYCQNHQLTEVILPEGAEISDMQLSGNLLESIDMSKITSVKNIYISDNLLTDIDLSKVVKGTLQIQNNLFTLATLPTKPAVTSTGKYTYAPQPAYAVPETVTELDLSSQLTATGVGEAPVTTTYSFETAGGTALVEGTDYQVTAPGKFKFIKAQAEKVHGVMTTAAFPKFTGKNAYVTTEFNVEAAATASLSWNFTTWSAATVANLLADAAASKTEGWSDVEKAADAAADAEPAEAAKDNCFWFAGTVNADGSLSANGKVIEELKGLKFDPDYAAKRSLAIAVNYPKALSEYAGGAYLWLGGGGSKQAFPCFTIPGVKAGQKLTVVIESHKASDARGIQIYADSYDAANQIGDAFKPTTQDTYTWTIDKDCDVVVWNTSGCHIYTMTIE